VLFALALATASAQAQISCTADLTDVNFVVNPLSSQADATASLSYSCHNSAWFTRYSATVCFSIGDGSQGGGAANPRRMLNGTQPLWFQLYQDPARTLVWGSSFFGVNTPVAVPVSINAGATISGTRTMYGRVQAGQTTAMPGLYLDDFNGSHTAITVNDASGSTPPGSCSTGNQETDRFGFYARATVSSQCSVSAGTLNFGNAGLLTSATDGTTAISVQCANGVAYEVGLVNGQNASGTTRRMRNATRYVTYEVYRNSARTQRWGNTLNADTVTGTGNGNIQNLSVYGRVPAQTTPNAGTYTDVVVVTVTY
jgi:spore coat protein U-like protein